MGRGEPGIEARMNRLAEACDESNVNPTYLLNVASNCNKMNPPQGSPIMRARDLVWRLEWAFQQITGHSVPRKAKRWRG